MSRILLHLDHRRNTSLLADLLARRHEAIVSNSHSMLDEEFDLCVLDHFALNRIGNKLRSRKEAEKSAFLPFLLITSRDNVGKLAQHLWKGLDEVIVSPVQKIEVLARVESLLNARRLSLELKRRNENLEAFINSMTHDLRAPLRTISGFADALSEDYLDCLDETGRDYVRRIRSSTGDMWRLIDALVEFSRLNRNEPVLRTVKPEKLIVEAVASLKERLEAKDAQIEIVGECAAVKADPALLRTAIDNILSNAIKYVAPGTLPKVTIHCSALHGLCRIEFRDNGIGIAPENRERIFTPFVRLHGIEEYPGLGLGLPSASKVLDMMSGRLQLDSSSEHGSTFSIELGCA